MNSLSKLYFVLPINTPYFVHYGIKMKTFLKICSSYKFWVGFCFIYSVVFAFFFRFSNPEKRHNVVISDAKGYYAYFSGFFIYDDLNFNFNQTVELKDHPETQYTDYRYKLDKDRVYTKYYIGTAIAYTPMLLSAHAISVGLGWPSDGYTLWYHYAVVLASLIYLTLAMIFMRSVFEYFDIKSWVKNLIIVGVYLGTNWFFYTTWESGLSHSYSAAVIACFLALFIKYKQNLTPRRMAILGALLGFIILLRPTNLFVVAFLPIFFPSRAEFTVFFRNSILRNKATIAGLLTVFSVVFIQLICYKVQIDQWYIYAYEGEGFNFLKPNIQKFLFSIRKGYFIYTPIMIFSLFGLYRWYKKSKFQVSYWLLIMFAHIYILSCWHMWWYGGTFGTRVMVEYYIFWMIPIGVFFSSISRKYVYLSTPLFLFFILNGQLQTYSYIHGMLLWDNMTWKLFKDVFLFPMVPYGTF